MVDGPAGQWRRPTRLFLRFLLLNAGLVAFGIGIAVMARADLGLGPWAALHQGISHHVGLPMGTVEIVVGVLVLAAWIPLRERPGPGTLLAAFVVGLATNVGLDHIQPVGDPTLRVAAMFAGAGLIALGSAFYLSAAMGPGPRDGLMTGIQRRFGWPLAWVRTGIEASALIVGAALGGAIGPGTIVYAVIIGPLLWLILRQMGSRHVLWPGRP